MDEQTTFTPHGIPIYSCPNPGLHSFCICLYVKGGPLYETPENNGLSHFFEHIVFKNINRTLGGGLYQKLDRLGLCFGACTYRELLQFTITGAIGHFRDAADIFSLIFSPVNLPKDQIALERRRILAEIREEDEKNTIDFFSQKKIWKDTSLEQSILGKKKVLKKTGCAELSNMQESLLAPGNCFYYLTGNVTEADIGYLKKISGENAPFAPRCVRDNTAPVPRRFCRRKETLHIQKSKVGELSFSFDFHTGNHTEAERTLLYDLLFSGENSRIFQELSEKSGYIYSFDSQLEEYANIGCLSFSFEISPDLMVKAAKKVTRLLTQLKRGEEICLEYVLPLYLDNAKIKLDDAESLNWTLAYERHFLGESWLCLEERSRCYKQVTPEKIQALAKEIFRPENLTLCYKGRKKAVPKKLKKTVFSGLGRY